MNIEHMTDERALKFILTKEEKVQISYIKKKYKDDKLFRDICIQDYLENINFEKRLREYLRSKWWTKIILNFVNK